MRKFFVQANQIYENKIKIINEDVNHIKNVLRLEKKGQIKIGNKETGKNYIGKIIEIKKEEIICEILYEALEEIESKIQISVFQGLPKADKMEIIIQKGTELGAYEFIPVECKRSIVKLSSKNAETKINRWQKIAEMASKQSGRDIVPKINNIKNIKNIYQDFLNYDIILVAYENEETNSLKTELEKIDKTKENIKIAIIIGPEGGFEFEEIENLKTLGAKIVTLGKRILRTETASLNMISIIMYELEV